MFYNRDRKQAYTIHEIQSGMEQLEKEIQWLRIALNINGCQESSQGIPAPPGELKQLLISLLEDRERLQNKCDLALKHVIHSLRIIELDL